MFTLEVIEMDSFYHHIYTDIIAQTVDFLCVNLTYITHHKQPHHQIKTILQKKFFFISFFKP